MAPGPPHLTCAASGARPAPTPASNGVTPPTFRKTVATLIDKEANTDHAAAQLGHGSKEVTKKHYIVKPALAPDSSAILELLGGTPESHDPGQTRTVLNGARLDQHACHPGRAEPDSPSRF